MHVLAKMTFFLFQVLILNAMLGSRELHSDNSIALGKSIFSLIARRTMPQQAIPSTALLLETFAYKFGEVQNDYELMHLSREYYYRPRICHDAWRLGLIKDLNCVIGNHPLEDVIHIHGWVHVHHMLCGKLPDSFYFIPATIMRNAELVPGRIYPVLQSEGNTGVICVCPEGKAFALLKMSGEEFEVIPLERWQSCLAERQIQVAPLIFRKHAVVMDADGTLGLVSEQAVSLPANLEIVEAMNVQVHQNVSKNNYLNFDGKYLVMYDEYSASITGWQTLHEKLLPLGTHLAISTVNINRCMVKEKLANGSEVNKAKVPNHTCTHVVGYLRYPDECDKEYDSNEFIFVAFRVKSYSNEFEEVCILPVPAHACELPHLLSDNAQSVDYLSPNVI